MTDDKDRTTGETVTRARVRELRDRIVDHMRRVPVGGVGLQRTEAESVVAALGVLLVLPERRNRPSLDVPAPGMSLDKIVRAMCRVVAVQRDPSFVHPFSNDELATLAYVAGAVAAERQALGEAVSDEVDAAYRASVLAAAPPAGPPRSVVNVLALLAALLERMPLPELGRAIEGIAGADAERLEQKIETSTWCHDGVRACLDVMAARLLGGPST